MFMINLPSNCFLDNYILNVEFSRKANISSNAYRYWKDIIAARFEGSRTVFLKKRYIPEKYQEVASQCTPLNGLVSSAAFCSFTGLASSHLIKSNGSNLYEKFQIVNICGVKFVNLKKFYDDLKLDYSYNIYIEKCCFFSPAPLEKKIQLTGTMCVGYY